MLAVGLLVKKFAAVTVVIIPPLHTVSELSHLWRFGSKYTRKSSNSSNPISLLKEGEQTDAIEFARQIIDSPS